MKTSSTYNTVRLSIYDHEGKFCGFAFARRGSAHPLILTRKSELHALYVGGSDIHFRVSREYYEDFGGFVWGESVYGITQCYRLEVA